MLVLYLLKRRRATQKRNGKMAKKTEPLWTKFSSAEFSRFCGSWYPQFFSMETGYLALIAAMLVARTYCDVWMIQNGTMIESGIISRDSALFKKHFYSYIKVIPGIALVNNFLKLGLFELKLRFRERLTKNLYDQYLQGFTYYKMGNLDNRIANPDQLLTQDVEKFCNSVVDLYSNLSKPLLDICLYIYKLTTAIGAQGPTVMMTYLLVSGMFLTRMRRPMGKMTVTEQRYEGEYRFVNSRLITNSEEIAFYNGNEREKQTIHSTFKKLVDHLHQFIFFRFSMGFVDSMIAKYLATVVGYLVVSRPFLTPGHSRHLTSTHSELLERQDAPQTVPGSGPDRTGRREMTRLSGFTSRITELMKVLKDLNSGKYVRTMVSQNEKGELRHQRARVWTKRLWKELSVQGARRGEGQNIFFVKHLWPLFGGSLTKPERGKLFYVPQRPYMTLGSLRDQVIYPDTYEDQQRKGISDQVLKEYLDNVQLGHILDREGSWDCVQDWMDVLSGGEKQRMAPQFAILDECTSAVSVDVEDFIYSHCRTVGITLFTVSHRKSLWKHHEFYLHMDGRGNYEFKPITEETVEFGS
ncbi:hypothetical protein F7725_029028 [Dissostichus mawsoni]|uniref:ABC transmembrane type-1 domain-containing protein n=1 Tax=Dissostichus mawsoni TaxID=36200 RepID=A0A7J5XHM8_DISMA|nr:hypothetical protein F7725_029028 [Dissostichus mawsoni]